jgi:hypothetical protein
MVAESDCVEKATVRGCAMKLDAAMSFALEAVGRYHAFCPQGGSFCQTRHAPAVR